jgi:hypothetical protein
MVEKLRVSSFDQCLLILLSDLDDFFAKRSPSMVSVEESLLGSFFLLLQSLHLTLHHFNLLDELFGVSFGI